MNINRVTSVILIIVMCLVGVVAWHVLTTLEELQKTLVGHDGMLTVQESMIGEQKEIIVEQRKLIGEQKEIIAKQKEMIIE